MIMQRHTADKNLRYWAVTEFWLRRLLVWCARAPQVAAYMRTPVGFVECFNRDVNLTPFLFLFAHLCVLQALTHTLTLTHHSCAALERYDAWLDTHTHTHSFTLTHTHLHSITLVFLIAGAPPSSDMTRGWTRTTRHQTMRLTAVVAATTDITDSATTTPSTTTAAPVVVAAVTAAV
jgi:hypothetical protein